MDLNKEYLVKDYPLEELEPGTIIRTIEYDSDDIDEKFDKDILVITRRLGSDAAYVVKHSLLIAIDIKDGNTYTEQHSVKSYEILRLPNK